MKRGKLSLTLVLVSILNAVTTSCYTVIMSKWLNFDVQSDNLMPYLIIVGVLTVLNILTLRDYIKE